MDGEYQNLRCFQHCQKDVDIICFRLPLMCPICQQCTATTESRIPPYVLPSPFTSSLKTRRSVVLKPTHGNFTWNYSRACNLHIGISDENGLVHDFDEKGLNHGSVWSECLAILTCVFSQSEAWDTVLNSVCDQPSLWCKSRYHEDQWNCFDFVLYFLQQLGHRDVTSSATMSKSEFCKNFLTQKTKGVEQYIHLCRQALLTGFVLIPKNRI